MRNVVCCTFFFIEIFTIFNLKSSFDPICQDYHLETRFKVEIPSALKTQKRRNALAELSFKCWEESGPEPGLDIVWTLTENSSGIPLCINMLGNPQ